MKAASRHVVVNAGADPRYLPTGHIVYAIGGILFAQPFDVTRRETVGSPVAVVEGVNRATAFSDGNSQFWVSDGGTLIYQPGVATTRTLINGIVVGDRQGRMQALKLPDSADSAYESPRVSPDGNEVAYVIDDGQQANIWIAPLSGATEPRKLTFEGRNRFPVWSPDGTRIAFQSNREGGGLAIYSQRTESGRAERLTAPDVNVEHMPESWTRAGDLLSYSAVAEEGASLWVMSVGDRKATQIPNITSQSPLNSSFSPDGQWLVYGARRLQGGANIFVQSIPPRDQPFQLTDGIPAHHPIWSPDGTEIFFFSGTSPLLAISLSTKPTFSWRAAVPAAGGFPPMTTVASGHNYDIARDAKRFVFIGYPNQDGGVNPRNEQQLNVVLNWFDALKTLVN
jgi:WD40 repeat protein